MTQPIKGYNPQSYLGVTAPTPPNLVVLKRAPTQNDYQNFNIGDLWLVPQQNNPPSNQLYVLVSKALNVATWSQVFPGAQTGAIETITGNSGGAVGPNTADPANLNLLGSHGITVTGNPGAFTLTSAINNTITLGDVTPVAVNSDALTITTGDVTIADGNILLPLAESDGSAGYIGMPTTGNASDNRVFWIPVASTTNTFSGYQSGNIAVSGTDNNAYGNGSLAAITSGSSNCAFGTQSLRRCTSGDLNIALGSNSLDNLTTAESNIGIGHLALSEIVDGSFNIAIGNGSLQNLPTNGSGNVAIGHSAFQLLTTSSDAVAIGYQAGANATASIGSTLVGFQAGLNLTTASFSTFVGRFSGTAVTTSEGNTFIGAEAGQAVTTGDGYNAVFGAGSFNRATTAARNTILGGSVGFNLLTGTDNVMIGYGSGSTYTGAETSNVLIYNDGVVGDNQTIRIGIQGTHARCFVGGIRGITTGVADAIPVLIDSNGQLGTVSSSKRYKTNIKDMDDHSSRVMDLRPVCFVYKSNPETETWGLIAEEVQEVFPELVVTHADKPETVKYHDLAVLLLNELQKLNKRVKYLEDKLSQL